MVTELDYEYRQLLIKRVRLGAEWLDERQPDWWQRINIDTLNLVLPRQCVLGQLSRQLVGKSANYCYVVLRRDFRDGCTWAPDLKHLGLIESEAIDLGFQVGEYGWTDGDLGLSYAALNDAWREQILDRRIAAGTNG